MFHVVDSWFVCVLVFDWSASCDCDSLGNIAVLIHGLFCVLLAVLIGRQVVKHCSVDPWLFVCSYLIGRAEHCSVVPGLTCVLACLVELDPKRSKL